MTIGLTSLAFFIMTWVQYSCEDSSVIEIVEITSNSEDICLSKEKEAIQQAMAFVCDLGVITRGTLPEEEIASFYTWTDSDFQKSIGASETADSSNDTLMYIVNFKNGKGYVILSATSPTPEILAYVEHGSLTPTTPIKSGGCACF